MVRAESDGRGCVYGRVPCHGKLGVQTTAVWHTGHIGADLITLASMLRIPVSMHNVSEDRIYRPHTWSAYGTKDLEAADYRACADYGPLY